MYMYQDSLAMETTFFTMNVGAAAASFLQQPAPPGASVMSLQDLNINMFMYQNEMTMTDTNFQMNVHSLPFSPDLQAAGILGGDLARILLLNVLTMSNAVENMDVQFGDNRETDDTKKVWKWLKGWSPSSSVGATSANINMHMYDNKMSMDGTLFKMNVGSDPELAGLAVKETVQAQGANGSAVLTASESALFTRKEETVSASAQPAPAKEWKLYRSAMDMKNTEFSISAGSLLQEGNAAPVPGSGADINMYMYSNEMSMKTTDFTMNVGDVPASLLQASSRHAEAQSMVMNAGRLNIRMYMYKNDMSMTDTDLSWTIG